MEYILYLYLFKSATTQVMENCQAHSFGKGLPLIRYGTEMIGLGEIKSASVFRGQHCH